MHKWPRIILNGLTAGSLLLMVGSAALWERSYLRTDFAFKVTQAHWMHVTNDNGRIEIYWKSSTTGEFGGQKMYYVSRARLKAPGAANSSRLELDASLNVTPRAGNPALAMKSYSHCWEVNGWGLLLKGNQWIHLRVLIVPHWIPLMFFAMLPGGRALSSLWRRNFRLKRKRLGLCVECGYDLRASSLRCPECGVELAHTR